MPRKKKEKKQLVNRESTDWYESHIEEPLRELVRHLRNNGINTECSCAHDTPMYIQCQFLADGPVYEAHKLVWSFLHEHGQKIDFSIKVRHEVHEGHTVVSSMEIELPGDESNIDYWKRMRDYHIKRAREYEMDIKGEEK